VNFLVLQRAFQKMGQALRSVVRHWVQVYLWTEQPSDPGVVHSMLHLEGLLRELLRLEDLLRVDHRWAHLHSERHQAGLLQVDLRSEYHRSELLHLADHHLERLHRELLRLADHQLGVQH
jgi:hypothetical protein